MNDASPAAQRDPTVRVTRAAQRRRELRIALRRELSRALSRAHHESTQHPETKPSPHDANRSETARMAAQPLGAHDGSSAASSLSRAIRQNQSIHAREQRRDLAAGLDR